MWPLAALFALPVIEIALFVTVGSAIGLLPTLAIVLLTPVLGLAVIRRAGARAMADLRQPLGGLRDPAVPVAEGAVKVLAGVLLILPGFFTDALGLLLLVPPLRRGLLRAFGRRIVVMRPGGQTGQDPFGRRAGPEIIDGDFHEIPQAELPPRPKGPSGWTQG